MMDLQARILVIDDFETVRVFLCRALQDIGFTKIEEAANGAEALALMRKRSKENTPFQIVFSDWNMPEMTGLQLLKAVRADAKLSSTLFFMITAESELGHIKEAVDHGVTDYVVKPFSIHTLRTKLQQLEQRSKKTS